LGGAKTFADAKRLEQFAVDSSVAKGKWGARIKTKQADKVFDIQACEMKA